MITGHKLGNRTFWVRFETNVAVCKNTNELSLFGDRNARNVKMLHSGQSFT